MDDSLGYFLDEYYIPEIKSNKIAFAVSNEKFISIILAGTDALRKQYERMPRTNRVRGPTIRHRDNEEDYDYWNYLFPTEYWLELARIVEQELGWPDDFSSDWATYMNSWTYALINPATSEEFLAFYAKEIDEGSGGGGVTTERNTDVDPYLMDYDSSWAKS